MICRNCGGQLPENSRACSFCGAEACGVDESNKGEATQLEKRMAEILMGSGCGNGGGQSVAEEPQPTWWKEDQCGGCGGGLTGTDKDMKYVLAIVGLIVGVIVFALVLKSFL